MRCRGDVHLAASPRVMPLGLTPVPSLSAILPARRPQRLLQPPVFTPGQQPLCLRPPVLHVGAVPDATEWSVNVPIERMWSVTAEYENILTLQRDQQLVALRHRDAEVEHLRKALEALEGRFDEGSIIARIRAKEGEIALGVEERQKELDLFTSLLRMRDQQIAELQGTCEMNETRLQHLRECLASQTPLLEADLEMRREQLPPRLDELRDEVQQLRAHSKRLEEDLSTQRRDVAGMNCELSAKQDKILRLEADLENSERERRQAQLLCETLQQEGRVHHDRLERELQASREITEQVRKDLAYSEERVLAQQRDRSCLAPTTLNTPESPADEFIMHEQHLPRSRPCRDMRDSFATSSPHQTQFSCMLADQSSVRHVHPPFSWSSTSEPSFQVVSVIKQTDSLLHSVRESDSDFAPSEVPEMWARGQSLSVPALSAALTPSDASLRESGTFFSQSYRPHPGDPVDSKLAEFVNRAQHSEYRGLFCRLGEGSYLYGTQRSTLRVRTDRLEALVEGEWIPVEDFVRRMEGTQGIHMHRT